MKIIYTHIDPTNLTFLDGLSFSDFTFSEWPEYAEISKVQSEKFYECIVLRDELLEQYKDEITEFYNKAKEGFPSYYNDTFWLLTTLRLYLVYLYVRDNDIKEFIHMEYDNLIFSKLDQLLDLPKSIYFTQVGPYCGSAGFMFCNSIEQYKNFIDRLFGLFAKGENVVRQFTGYGQLSEMVLIDLIHEHTKEIEYLPLFPDDKHFETLQCVFDGASYGQYLGGTNIGHAKGWSDTSHFVGQRLSKNEIEIKFDQKPFLTYNNKIYEIGNIHVHSKNLKEFVNV